MTARAQWTSINCPPLDTRAEHRFEVVRPLWGFEGTLEPWSVISGGQQAEATLSLDGNEVHGDGQSLRVDYTFTGDKQLEYVELACGYTLPEPGFGLGLWIRQDGDNPLVIRVRIKDNSGETHQLTVSRAPESVWAFRAVLFDTPGNAWGGDGNRKLDYPCTLYSIAADRPHRGYTGRGRLWLDDLSLVRAREARTELDVQVWAPPLGHVYTPGADVRLRLSGAGDTVRWTLKPFAGAEIARGEGPAARTDVTLPADRHGYFECELALLVDGRVDDLRTFRYAVLPEPVANRPNTYVGFCCHFRNSAYPIETMDLLKRYGFSEFRDEISWHAFEPERGVYRMPEYGAQYTQRAAELGMSPLLIFDYGNRAYDDGGFPNSDEAVAAYAAYAAELARRLRGRVNAFEIWNEWSGGCGMHGKPGENTPEYYAKMIRAAYPAIKAVDPDITVVGVGGEHSAHHAENIRGMFGAGAAGAMDVVSVHSYRYPRTPEESDLFGEIMAVADMAREEGAPQRIWVTEIGWPTQTDTRGVDEREQARLMVRCLALLAAAGVVEKVHWYDFKDDGLERAYNENNFGVIRHQRFNLAPKPAAVAASVFARLTAGANAATLMRRDGAYTVRFVLPDRPDVAVAWTPNGESPIEVGDRKALDLMGVPIPASPSLSPTPIYLIGP